VDQEVRVEELDRDGGVEGRFQIRRGAHGAITRDQQRCAEPFAPAQAKIAERRDHVDDFRAVCSGVVHFGVEQARETLIDVAPNRVE
jgi:hypothetical protein